MKFKIGDRVIVNGESGTIIDYDLAWGQNGMLLGAAIGCGFAAYGSSEVFFYRIKFDDNLKNAIRYWYKDIQLDKARIRAEKLNKLL
jgi:hypothetical protein